ncbi:flavodoxin domain-containing protein [Actinomycetota bacterium Odt1-20B]
MAVLVSYASDHGSTRDVAERIASRLDVRGHRTEVLPAHEIRSSLDCTAAVVGSAVHHGAWLPDASAFVRRHHDDLAALPVWMFSVGMVAALRGPLRRIAERAEQPDIVRLVESIGPRGYRRFSGVIRPSHLGRLGGMLFRVAGGRYGDYRDWGAIDAWADDIADALRP